MIVPREQRFVIERWRGWVGAPALVDVFGEYVGPPKETAGEANGSTREVIEIPSHPDFTKRLVKSSARIRSDSTAARAAVIHYEVSR
jgi:hypothetical protein